MIPAPPYNHVRNYTFSSLIHCLVDVYTVITVDIYFSCITSIRYLCASVADKGSEGLCAVCINLRTGKDNEFRESCIVVPVQNGWSVCFKHIIRLPRTHHLFPSNASSVFLKRIILLFFPFLCSFPCIFSSFPRLFLSFLGCPVDIR